MKYKIRYFGSRHLCRAEVYKGFFRGWVLLVGEFTDSNIVAGVHEHEGDVGASIKNEKVILSLINFHAAKNKSIVKSIKEVW